MVRISGDNMRAIIHKLALSCFQSGVTAKTVDAMPPAGTLYGVQTALAVLAMTPLVLVGYFIQSHLARGMTFGAIKQ